MYDLSIKIVSTTVMLDSLIVNVYLHLKIYIITTV